jgi:hypothetical protein
MVRKPPRFRKNRYLEESRKECRELRKLFKERIKSIQEKRLEQQRKKQQELERKEAERLKKAETMTNDVCYYGFWQNSLQVDEGIAAVGHSTKEVEKALKSHIFFRKNVLKQQYMDKTVFNLTKKIKKADTKSLIMKH